MHVVYQILKQCAAGWQTNQSESNIVRPGWMCSAPRKKKDLAGAERDGGVGLGVWWRGRGGVEASGGPGWGGSITACQIRRLGTALPCHHALWSWRRVSLVPSPARFTDAGSWRNRPFLFVYLFLLVLLEGGACRIMCVLFWIRIISYTEQFHVCALSELLKVNCLQIWCAEGATEYFD